jgi:catechol 2,3-dioxygenase-like lactoylglutathione lyase family enzyme
MLFLPTLLSLILGGAGPDGPLVTGRVISADGGNVAGVWVFVRGAAHADSVQVDASGSFALEVPSGVGDDTLEISTDAADPAARRYHPALVRLPRREVAGEHVFVLVPREWTIPTGTYAGTRVEISLERAFRPVCRGCTSFYRRGRDPWGKAPRDLVRTWPESMFPLRVAFDREEPGGVITPRDSVDFWRAVEGMEIVFGTDLFRPASYRETLSTEEGSPDDVVLVQVDPTIRASGIGIASAYGNEIVYGEVRVRWASLIGAGDGEHLVAHELMHSLGLGHTCSWPSVLADSRCAGRRSPVPTPQDVAYAQLVRRVRQLQRVHGARWGLWAARSGERAYVLGLLPEEES